MPETNSIQDNLSPISLPYGELQSQQRQVLDNMLVLERISNEFYLSPSDISHLDKHYLLQWQGSYIISLLQSSDNHPNHPTYIHHQDITYKVNFMYTSPWSLVVRKHDQFKVSFRLPKGEKIGICIIKHSPTKVGN